jgi:ACR3 family arsenite efflux pump ArsB
MRLAAFVVLILPRIGHRERVYHCRRANPGKARHRHIRAFPDGLGGSVHHRRDCARAGDAGLFHVIGDATVAQVNIPVAVLVWLMIVPMLLKIDLAALREVGQHWRGIASTVGVNWLIKPFSMALLAWIFVAHLSRPWRPSDQISSYTAGLILLAVAPCTAMVFVWSNLVDGEPHFTLSQVALNDTIMVVAFAPIGWLRLPAPH